MEAIAKYTNCAGAPRKMRLVADLVRGKDVKKALDILKFTRREGARHLEKVLTSAIANWTVKTAAEPDKYELYVSEVRIDAGMVLKRVQPAPQGRAHRIRKRYNHIHVAVNNRLPLENAGE
jgi:large subunit ribosomal protein L22